MYIKNEYIKTLVLSQQVVSLELNRRENERKKNGTLPIMISDRNNYTSLLRRFYSFEEENDVYTCIHA